jgi:hypothetical protein
VGVAELVSVVLVRGGAVGVTVFGFRQGFLRYAFLRIETVFVQEAVDPAGFLRRAQVIEDQAGLTKHAGARRGIKRGGRQQAFEYIRFGRTQQGGHFRAGEIERTLHFHGSLPYSLYILYISDMTEGAWYF